MQTILELIDASSHGPQYAFSLWFERLSMPMPSTTTLLLDQIAISSRHFSEISDHRPV
ncbi:MAG: hypothetical protein R2825_08325 [Saprospiraceae bacterium]